MIDWRIDIPTGDLIGDLFPRLKVRFHIRKKMHFAPTTPYYWLDIMGPEADTQHSIMCASLDEAKNCAEVYLAMNV